VAYTQADLDRVRTELLRAEQAVQMADRSVTYRPLDELRRLKDDIERELAQATRIRSKQTRMVASKGF
jgi:hypothetical protein